MTNAVVLAQGAGVNLTNRNRIINGDMRIDQRNAGASVTPSSGSSYTLDRWKNYNSQASKISFQQNAGSVTPPVGFTNYLGATSLSAYSVGSSDEFDIYQLIEGYNMADLGWGTASAQTVALSFWVRSSLTGTFGGLFYNTGNTRNYRFSYTISSANTWEYKTIIVTGDTSGTWSTTNGLGVGVLFSLGAGSSNVSSAGAWSSTAAVGVTGQVNLVGTSGATFYITGVQLEVGTVATPFENRQYGQELALCQRYYEKSFEIATPPTNGANTTSFFTAAGLFFTTDSHNNSWRSSHRFAVPKRATPAMTPYGNSQGYWNSYVTGWAENNRSITPDSTGFRPRQQASGSVIDVHGHWTADAEL